MANAFTSQTILDGPRNLVMRFTGTLDTANEARTLKVDVSTFDPAPLLVSVKRIHYSISEGLTVVMDWDATTDVTFAALTGSNVLDMDCFGGIPNNAGAGVTGDIYFTTLGWAGVKSYDITLELVKRSF